MVLAHWRHQREGWKRGIRGCKGGKGIRGMSEFVSIKHGGSRTGCAVAGRYGPAPSTRELTITIPDYP